jgi:HlyD family secretion protein
MTATVRIVTGRREDALRIPVEALRFRPPDGVAESENGRGGGESNRGEEMIAQLTERLGLTAEQQEKLKTAMAERQAQFAERRQQQGQGGGGQGGQQQGGEGSEQRQRGAGMERMLAGILTDEQMQKYREWRGTRSRRGGDGDGGRMATIWIADGSGIEPRRVRAGLSDDRFTEILSGELKEGDHVVVRASRPRTS